MLTKICCRCKLPKLLIEFSKAKSRKDGLTPGCKICTKAYHAAYQQTNKESLKAYNKEYKKKNFDIITANAKIYSILHKEEKRKYDQENKERSKMACRKRYLLHPGVANANNAKRRATKLNATPKWAELDGIKQLYIDCKAISKITGIMHHVDHIVPLQSELVCGLHCIANLQILAGPENTSKGNRFWPDMP